VSYQIDDLVEVLDKMRSEFKDIRKKYNQAHIRSQALSSQWTAVRDTDHSERFQETVKDSLKELRGLREEYVNKGEHIRQLERMLEVIDQGSTEQTRLVLDPQRKGARAASFDEKLRARIVGQDRAVRAMTNLYQTFLAGMNQPNRPVGTLLFLGPTGSGKTRVVEAMAETLFGDPNALIKIDCAEFQHSHEISKLVGSPPGYLGHRETPPLLTQENLERHHTEETKLSIVLFDEIEKASDSLWQLLLGILDKATLTLGNNQRVDFSKTVVVMTSNLGAREMTELVSGGIGFSTQRGEMVVDYANVDKKIYRTAQDAARRRFSPEFMNRVDKVVVFRTLTEKQLWSILDLELKAVQDRIIVSADTKFLFTCTPAAKEFLLREGIDLKYGARHLKRAVERFVVLPLANLVATEQVLNGESVEIDAAGGSGGLTFSKLSSDALAESDEQSLEASAV
jgi:ATP-dependent Clp protease ATP-binding subunit ClpB